jgi:ProP effector
MSDNSEATDSGSPVAPAEPVPMAPIPTEQPERPSAGPPDVGSEPGPTPEPEPPGAQGEPAPGSSESAALSVRACGDLLRQHFPALFGAGARPLKLRIQADIQQRAPGVFPRQVLSAFLRRHTGATAYLNAMARGGPRFDLDGQAAGEVAPEHREAAATEVARRRGNQQARIEQEREALRQQRDAVRQEREALRREQEALQREQYQAMRQRASLLYDFENTRLSTANFCVLKGIDPARLDELLAQARLEARQRREQEARHDADSRRAPGRGPDSEPRRDGGPRRDGPPRGDGGPRADGGPRRDGGPRPPAPGGERGRRPDHERPRGPRPPRPPRRDGEPNR